MTWQGQGGAGGSGRPDDADDATRTDWPAATPPTSEPPSPFAPGGPLADDAGLRPEAPLAPPAAPPPAGVQAPVNAPSPWAPPDEGAGSLGTMPPTGDGRYAVPGAPGLVYAGAIPRAAAYIVDSVLLGILISIVTLPFAATALTPIDPAQPVFDPSQFTLRSGVASVIGALIEGAYFVFLWMSAGRATLGMRLFNLQVGNAADGAKLRMDQAIKRWFAYGSWLGAFALAPAIAGIIGFATFAWTLLLLITTATSPTKQGLHDRFAGSAVVRPASAGNGLAITCLIVALALPLLLLFLLVPLIFLGGQMSDILSAVGESI